MTQLYPFTDPRVAEAAPPLKIVAGEGCTITDTQGRHYIDALSGLWCTSLGFCDECLIRAAERQMRALPCYQSFMGRTADVTEQLADALARKLPGDLNHVFFGCSGSDAVETAAKLVRFYWNARGRPQRKRIIARGNAYHGSLYMSASLTGMTYSHDDFDLPADNVVRLSRPYYFKDAHAGESERAYARRLADELDALIQHEGADTIGAFIAEPVIGSGGLIPPPEGYWDLVQEVPRSHDILLIADEIITGFGRTGPWFACERYGIQPAMMTMAKQLTGAYFPVSAVGVADAVYEAVASNAHTLGTFGHGLTYGGHPVAVAVALETLSIYEDMDLARHVARLGEWLDDSLKPVRQHPAVVDVRHVGFMAGVELAYHHKASDVAAACEQRGVILRVMDNTLAIAPPYVITESELRTVIDALAESLDKTTLDETTLGETTLHATTPNQQNPDT